MSVPFQLVIFIVQIICVVQFFVVKMGICSKKEAKYPEEFLKQIAQLSKIRDGTLQIVLQLEKMNSMEQMNPLMKKKAKKTPEKQQQNIVEQLALTCVKYNTLFAGHAIAEQMMRLSAAFRKLSKSKLDTQEQIEKQCIAPMRQWAGDGYDTLMKELIKCQKLKDELKKAETSKAVDKEKLDKAKKAYESQRAYCTKEFEATQKHFDNQRQYIMTMVELQYKESTLAHIALDGALMKNMTVQSQQK